MPKKERLPAVLSAKRAGMLRRALEKAHYVGALVPQQRNEPFDEKQMQYLLETEEGRLDHERRQAILANAARAGRPVTIR